MVKNTKCKFEILMVERPLKIKHIKYRITMPKKYQFTERHIEEAFVEFLKESQKYDAERTSQKSRILKSLNIKYEKGIPDIITTNQEGFKFFEIKHNNDKLSSSQIEYIITHPEYDITVVYIESIYLIEKTLSYITINSTIFSRLKNLHTGLTFSSFINGIMEEEIKNPDTLENKLKKGKILSKNKKRRLLLYMNSKTRYKFKQISDKYMMLSPAIEVIINEKLRGKKFSQGLTSYYQRKGHIIQNNFPIKKH